MVGRRSRLRLGDTDEHASVDAGASTRWQYSYSEKVGGVPGFIAAALLLSAIVVALVVGAVAITMVLWIALSLALLGVLVAVVRRIVLGGRDGPTGR